MLEPHATEIRQELVGVRVAALHQAARPSHPARSGEPWGTRSFDSVCSWEATAASRRRSRSPRRQGPSPMRGPLSPPGSAAATAFASELDLAWEAAAPYGIRVGAPVTRRRSLRIPSCRSISSKPRFTSSRAIRCEMSDIASISPASQRSTS